jgi:hypothetical protein
VLTEPPVSGLKKTRQRFEPSNFCSHPGFTSVPPPPGRVVCNSRGGVYCQRPRIALSSFKTQPLAANAAVSALPATIFAWRAGHRSARTA